MPYNADRRSNEVQIHEAALWTTKNFDAVLAESKMGFSDGTRGVGEVPICIRPAAFGAITFKYGILDGKPHFYEIECCGGQVPGEQTVPRAELWAAIVLMTRCNANAVARFGIDAAYVTQGVGNRQKLVKGSNGDLWDIFFIILDMRTCRNQLLQGGFAPRGGRNTSSGREVRAHLRYHW